MIRLTLWTYPKVKKGMLVDWNDGPWVTETLYPHSTREEIVNMVLRMQKWIFIERYEIEEIE